MLTRSIMSQCALMNVTMALQLEQKVHYETPVHTATYSAPHQTLARSIISQRALMNVTMAL
jgi:hypothetical protein